jgi:inorganic pyrophosphatase
MIIGFTRLFEDWASTEEARKAARAATDTDPSEEQKVAGNYRKGKFWWNSMEISIENPKGSVRRGKGWETTMVADYGYIRRTESEADGDHIDVFVGDDLSSPVVWIVNQNTAGGGRFDEHKCVIGVVLEKDAKELYLKSYSKDWKGFGSIVGMTIEQFKKWVEKGDTSVPCRPA